jgi:hypothetical protein
MECIRRIGADAGISQLSPQTLNATVRTIKKPPETTLAALLCGGNVSRKLLNKADEINIQKLGTWPHKTLQDILETNTLVADMKSKQLAVCNTPLRVIAAVPVPTSLW